MKNRKLQYWILVADAVWVVFALPLAYFLRFGSHWSGITGGSFVNFVVPPVLAITLWAWMFLEMGLDGFRRGWHPAAVLSQLFVALSLLMAALMAIAYVAEIFLSRLTLMYFGTLLFIGFTGIRYVVHAALGSNYLASTIRRVAILGNGAVAREMATKIGQHPEILCKVVGFIHSADVPFDPHLPVISEEAKTVQTFGLADLLREQHIDEVIIALSGPGTPEVMSLSDRCRSEGIAVSVIPYPYELYCSEPQLLDVGGIPVVQLREPKASPTKVVLKRTFDIIASICLLIICAPVIAIGAVALIGRKGGSFIREPRCGQNAKLFSMYRLNSDRDASGLPRYEKVLQQLSITEMPQLWNVIRGEMSVVGPRPESPERVKHYSDWQRQRLRIKPGITGLAQVSGIRQQHSSEEKTRFDLQYIMHSSLFLDVSLILQTAWTLVRRHVWTISSPSVQQVREDIVETSFERIMPSAHSTQSSAD